MPDDDPTTLDESAGPPDGVPLCLGCLTPSDPLTHYCPNCGEAVGRFTPYIPFVNIRFNTAVFGTMWQRLWSPGGFPARVKALYFLMITYFAWPMLVGLPFIAIRRMRGGTPRGDDN